MECQKSNKRKRVSVGGSKDPISQPSTRTRSKAPTSQPSSRTRCHAPSLQVRRDNGKRIPASYKLVFKDDAQKTKYAVLAKRKIIPTRYVDDPTLTKLGIVDDVYYLFDRVGWKEFVNKKSETYERLTLEFLSSLSVQLLRGKKSEQGNVKFRIFNTDHEMSLGVFNDLFGLPNEGAKRLGKFRTNDAWRELTGVGFAPETARSTYLSNPCIRYVHRLLSNTVFGRGESAGVVRSSELFLIWAMLTEQKVNTGAFIAGQLQRVSNTKDGKIVVGGLITTVALGLGYDLSALTPVSGPSRLDIDGCIAWEMIVLKKDKYFLTLPHSDVAIPLPNVEITSVKDKKNWRIGPASTEITSKFVITDPPCEPEVTFERSDLVSIRESLAAIIDEQKLQRLVL